MEYFPSHIVNTVDLALDELIPAFIHAEGDQLTSKGSTWPYAAKQCKDFLRILNQARDTRTPHTVSIVARFWSQVCKYLASLLPHAFALHVAHDVA